VKTRTGAEAGRWLPVIAATVAFVACGSVPGASGVSTPPAEAPVPDPQSENPRLSPGTTKTISVIDPNLDIQPVLGGPGEPLRVCGLLLGGSEVRVVFRDPVTGASWPEHVDEFVATDESGRWCWTGVIPTELQSNETATMGDLHPITDGIYEIRIESFGAIDVQATIEVKTPGSTNDQPGTDG
jgi:hypothetical protein